ncbi:Nn.00g096860.m01.CDS01 [Neocucurbitaria sp. VM-36]
MRQSNLLPLAAADCFEASRKFTGRGRLWNVDFIAATSASTANSIDDTISAESTKSATATTAARSIYVADTTTTTTAADTVISIISVNAAIPSNIAFNSAANSSAFHQDHSICTKRLPGLFPIPPRHDRCTPPFRSFPES